MFLSHDMDLFHIGRTLAGLYSLPDTQIILHHANWVTNSTSLAVEFDDIRLAIELSDHSDLWAEDLLAWCDVYAKRNLNRTQSCSTPEKVIPFGLNWAYHSRSSAIAVLKLLAPKLASSPTSRWKEIYRYLATPHWRAFEYRPDQPAEQAILFQTRVWSSADAPGDEHVNELRVNVIRALKREFGHRFQGGLVPTPLAIQNYPDLVSASPSRQSQYVRWAKRPLVAIYTRGLFGSLAFKMGEFLASSKCVVSEPIVNELSAPLDHLLTFRSEAECLASCDALLSDRQMAEFHREQAWSYYQRHLEPRAHMLDLLARARSVAGKKNMDRSLQREAR